jgi:hypothetical protein
MNRPFCKLFVGVLSTFLLIGRADASTLYTSTSGSAGGTLYIVDQATGAIVQNVGPLNDVNGINYGITGMAFHPTTGILYGATHNYVNASSATLRRLVTINPATAQVTVIGSFNLPVVPGTNPRAPTMSDISFDAAGNLYGVGSIGAQLYSINTSTGQATQIGNAGFDYTEGGGLAVSSAGVFYGTPHVDKYGTYSSTLGTFTFITNPVKPAGGPYGALGFDGGTLYGANKGNTSQRLVTIVPATGAVTDVGAIPLLGVDAIAFKPAAAADFDEDGQVDGDDFTAWQGGFGQAAGATKSIGDANGDFDVDGADFLTWQSQLTIGGAVTPGGIGVPEPSVFTLALLATGALATVSSGRSG